MKVTSIRVGHRFRADSDIRSLAASIDQLGLLHPVVVDGKGRLVAGARRFAAVKALGWRDVPVRVVKNLSDAANALRAERDENTERRQFRPSELVAIARRLEPLEKAEARTRQQRGGRPKNGQPKTGGKLPHHSMGKTRDRLGRVVGVSGRTLEKARAVVEAAEREPERYARVLRQMDKTGNIHGAHRLLMRCVEAESLAKKSLALPTGRFDVVAADPAWHYRLREGDVTQRGNPPYAMMSLEDICALPVAELAADDCILFLWTTNAHLRESFTVLDAWGFRHVTTLTWAKPKFGCGIWLRGQTEHCHLAVRGKPKVLLTNQSTLLLANAGSHSAKPEEFYRLVESLCRGSKLELFARRKRAGWVAWGNGVSADSSTDVVQSKPATKRVTRPAHPRTSGRTKAGRVGA